MPRIENHKHKQCWLPRFRCWPQRKSKHQKPSLSDHQKNFFRGRQILTQLLAHRSLHQKIMLASLQCPPLSLPSEWRRLGACESLNIFLHIRGKEKLIYNLQTLLFPSCAEVQTLSDIQLCVDNTTVLPEVERVESFIWICLKREIFSKPAIKTTTKLQES